MPPIPDRALNRYLQKRMREWLAAHPDENASSLAAKIGVSKSTVSTIIGHAMGAGTKARNGFAALVQESPYELEAAAARWHEENPDETDLDATSRGVFGIHEAQPNLGALLTKVARGTYSEGAIAAARFTKTLQPMTEQELDRHMRRVMDDESRAELEVRLRLIPGGQGPTLPPPLPKQKSGPRMTEKGKRAKQLEDEAKAKKR